MKPRHTGSPVGTFHATLSVPTSYTPGSVIIFDRAWYNSGEYSTNTGVFICPVNGVYVFSFKIMVNAGYYSYVDMYIDSTIVFPLHVPAISGQFPSSSATTIHHCNQYSEVMLKYNTGNGPIEGYHYCHFNGFLLYATS